MENRTPFDLNDAIRRWQKDIGKAPAFCADDLEELASHLRASVQSLKVGGLSEEEAFLVAVQRVGEREPLEREFAKQNAAMPISFSTVLFWIVASTYFFQVGYSVVVAVLALRELMEGRAFRRFLAEGPSAQQITNYFQSHSLHYPRLFIPTMSVVLLLACVLGLRLAAGNWKTLGTFLKSFERPIRAALRLVVLGSLITVLPAFLPAMLGADHSFHRGLWLPPDGWDGRAIAIVALVLCMVALARSASRKKPSVGPI